MAQSILSVKKGSPAYRAGLRAGDDILSINGCVVYDFIDYEYLTDETEIRVTTRRGEFKVINRARTDIGLSFDKPLMSGVRMCANKCKFCFVDQLPNTARDGMRVKDDDWRMSLMMGNYVTLTNVSDRELDRIIARHASPMYISVHTMNPDLRADIMGTDRAKKLPDQLKRLADGGISFHSQAVLCPNINDGDELERTISELIQMYPRAKSLALVPVGLTDHRDGLADLRKYAQDEARAVIAISDKWRGECLEKFGTRFVFPSDEFYLAANMPIPENDDYEDYAQIDDGVGMLRLFETEYAEAYREIRSLPDKSDKKIAIACGVSAGDFFRSIVSKYPLNADIRVTPIENRYFGKSVTVSGLVTGSDILRELHDTDITHAMISVCMLKDGEDVFLDGMTLNELKEKLNKRVVTVGRSGGDLLRKLIGILEEKDG